jgi:hypothetical protein
MSPEKLVLLKTYLEGWEGESFRDVVPSLRNGQAEEVEVETDIPAEL